MSGRNSGIASTRGGRRASRHPSKILSQPASSTVVSNKGEFGFGSHSLGHSIGCSRSREVRIRGFRGGPGIRGWQQLAYQITLQIRLPLPCLIKGKPQVVSQLVWWLGSASPLPLSLLGLMAKIKCSICSYQFNIWYAGHRPAHILIWFLAFGQGSEACLTLTTGCLGIALQPSAAHSYTKKISLPFISSCYVTHGNPCRP